MNYADIRPIDVANGPGIRVSLFVSGCTHACPECFNPEAWDFSYGQPFTQAEAGQILQALEKPYIKGSPSWGRALPPRQPGRSSGSCASGAGPLPGKGHLVLFRLSVRGPVLQQSGGPQPGVVGAAGCSGGRSICGWTEKPGAAVPGLL